MDSFSFVDLGCGKAWPLRVASEFPFRDIVGVELSNALAEVARGNARLFKQRFPDRTVIRIEEADATTFRMPPGNYLVYLYSPFDMEIVQQIVRHIEASLAEQPRIVYVVYYNPAAAKAFDDSASLSRRSVRLYPYATEEVGYGPDSDDLVAIWQSAMAPPTTERTDAMIVRTSATRARLRVEPSPAPGILPSAVDAP